jgi:hypothetical protein
MANKSDKSLVGILIAACSVIILIFHFAWAKYLFANYSQAGFAVVDIVILVSFAGASFIAYKNADDPNKDHWRWALVLLAIASSIWAAAWSTGLMNNLSQGL